MSRAQYRVIQAAERAGIGLLQVEWKVCSVCKTCVGTQCVCDPGILEMECCRM